MSSAPKGYSTSQKLDRLSAEYACVMPTSENTNGLAVAASLFVYVVGTDAAEAGSTNYSIVATGIESVARKGDMIRWTSGDLAGKFVHIVDVATDKLTVSEDMGDSPDVGDAFSIQRYVNPVTNSTGGLAMALSYIRNGVSQDVIEDTVTPANNRPLPVKIESTSGEVNITAGDLNVQMEHDGATPASVRIGDGSELLSITTANQAEVHATHSGAAYSSVRIGDGTTLAGVTTDNELKVQVSTTSGSSKAIAPTYNDYVGSPVTTAAYVEIVASTGDAIRRLQIFDSSGETMILATGAIGAEVDLMYVFPGGIETLVAIPAGTRLSLKAKTANATAGYFAMNSWK